MAQFYLKYNPFTIVSYMTINGKKIGCNDKLYEWREEPLQVWLDRLLPTLVETCNEDEFEITFHGLQADYDKLHEQINNYRKNEKKEVSLTFVKTQNIEDRILELINLLESIQKESSFDALNIDDIKKDINKLLGDDVAAIHSDESALIIKKALDELIN